jgi:hypothetical protein
MDNKVFKFDKQERKGKVGESRIIKAWPDQFEWFSGNEYDLILKPDTSVEVKTETDYSLQSSPNFFMERYSEDITFKPGGPWRAKEDNVDIFISYFIQNDILFWFDNVEKLVERCEEGIKKFNIRVSYVKNRGYHTIGYPIRRYWFEDLYEEIEIGAPLPL